MHANQLQNAVAKLREAIQEMETVLKTMRAERDPLAVHIFLSRRSYGSTPDTENGKRAETIVHLTWETASDLRFRGTLRRMGKIDPRPPHG